MYFILQLNNIFALRGGFNFEFCEGKSLSFNTKQHTSSNKKCHHTNKRKKTKEKETINVNDADGVLITQSFIILMTFSYDYNNPLNFPQCRHTKSIQAQNWPTFANTKFQVKFTYFSVKQVLEKISLNIEKLYKSKATKRTENLYG